MLHMTGAMSGRLLEGINRSTRGQGVALSNIARRSAVELWYLQVFRTPATECSAGTRKKEKALQSPRSRDKKKETRSVR